MGVFEALLIACYYWFAWWDWGMIGNITTNCTFIGFIFGLAYGDVTTGIILGATINAMYLTTVAAGGNLPTDPALACCVAIPIALHTGMSPALAVALSVPFALVGPFLDNTRRIANGVWNRVARKCADNLNFKGIGFAATAGPILVQFLIRVPIITAIVILMGKNAESIMNLLPPWLMHAFTLVGNILPGIGMVLCATLIGRKGLIPFFVLGFFVFKFTNMPILLLTIFAVCVAVIYIQIVFPKKSEAAMDDDEDAAPSTATQNVAEYNGMLSKVMRFKIAMRILFRHRFANSMEALFGTGVGYALMPALRVIYKDDPEGLKESLNRHMQPYISEMTWGNCIMGATLAMEEQKKMGASIAGNDIAAVKSGLMGPFAGFGDSLNWATIAPIIRGVFLPFGMAGSFLGVLMEPFVRLYAIILGYFTFEQGYKLGRNSLTSILRGGWLEKVMTGAGVLGMCMLGAMGAKYTVVTTPVTIALSTGKIVLQERIDAILPGLFSALVLGGAYYYLYKGGKYLKLVGVILAGAVLVSVLGIF